MFLKIVGKMAFIGKTKLISNLFNRHVFSRYPFLDKLHFKIVDVIPVGNPEVPFKISAKVGLGNIKMPRYSFTLYAFRTVYILMNIRYYLIIIKGTPAYR